VFDSLPYRAFRWDRDRRILLGELVVNLANGQLQVELAPLFRDENTDLIAQHLAATRYSGLRYDYSPLYLEVWKEFRRVLNPQGISVIGDYSTDSPIQVGMNTKGRQPEFDLLFGQELAVARTPYVRDLTHHIDFELQQKLAAAAGFSEGSVIDPTEFEGGVSGDALGTAISLVCGGRKLLVTSGSKVAPGKAGQSADEATAELRSLADTTIGCQNVIRALARQPEAARVTEIFKRHGLRGGAFWAIYSDLANNDIRRFVELVLSEQPRVIEYAKRYTNG
jgi:hypothetical protein